MKATMEFNLHERDEQIAHLRCVRNWELAWALWSVMQEIRKAIENSEHDGDLIDGEALSKACWEIVQDNNLNLDEMVY
jgi:hypothetical protein